MRLKKKSNVGIFCSALKGLSIDNFRFNYNFSYGRK